MNTASGDGDGPTAARAFVTGGVRIDALTLDQAIDRLLRTSGPLSAHLCNAYTVALASRHAELRGAINAGTLNLADGMPIVWIARMLGFAAMTTRVYGPDLMAGTLEAGQQTGAKHYLYGSTPGVLAALQSAIASRWPQAKIVGVESPPFDRQISDGELADSVARMSAAQADIVWVGMGTPKQDVLVERFRAIGSQRFVAIGAAFDFVAGSKRQAPRVLRRMGLEWVFRLFTEPRRLWRRYLFGNTRFIWVNLVNRPKRLP